MTESAIVWKKAPFETKASQRRERGFVIVPARWVQHLFTAKHAATLIVALYVLRQNFETHGKPFKLPNGKLEMDTGVSRKQKWRALGELERFGLIVIERRKKKSPVITALGAGKS